MLNRWLLTDRVTTRPGAAWLDDGDRSWSPWPLPSDDPGPLKLIVGTAGDDDLHGTRDDDTIDGLQGADQMAGRKGNDTYVADNIGDTIVEQAHQGQDVVMASVSYTLGANVEHIGLTGTDNINATGNELDNRLYGNVGANELDGKAGADTMVGGAGNDIYYVDDPGDVVKEHNGEGIDTVRTSIDYTLGKSEENLSLWPSYPHDLVGTGNELANLMEDGIGSDLLSGLGGNDTIQGGNILSPGGVDTLYGGDGDDVLSAGQKAYSMDEMYGGRGNDTLQAGAGANSLFGDEGDDLLIAGSGGMGHGPADLLDGGDGQDTLQGGLSLNGGAGDDLLETTGMSGWADGGQGNDTIEGNGGGGYIYTFQAEGGAGDDWMNLFSTTLQLIANGGEGQDTITCGGLSNLTIDGGAGDDMLTGNKYAPGILVMSGGDGSDTIVGNGQSGRGISLSGGNGRDNLLANAGSGVEVDVTGDAGKDTLHATGGLATLHGGAGADLFILSAKEVLGETMITVADFATSVDQLSLSQSSLAVGDGDLLVEGAVEIAGPGGFDACAELVIVAADIFGDLTLDKAAAAIGSANQAYAAGQTVVFTVDNGSDSWVLYFQSNGADAAVSAAELSIVGQLNGAASTGAEDVTWGT